MSQLAFKPPLNGSLLFSYLKNRRIIAVLTTCILLALLIHIRTAYYSIRSVSSYLPSLYSTAQSTGTYSNQTIPGEDSEAGETPPDQSTSTFWPQFYAALLAATPRCAMPHHHIEAFISTFYPNSGSSFRQSLIELDEADIDELATAHAWFVQQITAPDFPKPYFVPGSQGIVTTAGGEFLPEALVAIRMLRRTGSTLPVDLFLAGPEEVEGDICTTVLPALNARCHVLSELIDLEQGGLPRRQSITKYQLKAFALLLSTFDDMLWMDADEIPLLDPALLMAAEPFASRGLVTWPDYWFSTTSPLYFRVANISEARTPSPAARAASETGQLLLSKSRGNHLLTLQLATYYNFHGPTHYYKLFSQGAVGEGDKETFLGAATALSLPFWAVASPIDTIGYIDSAGHQHNTGMLQADPRRDYDLYKTTPTSQPPRAPPAFLHDEQHKPSAGRYSLLWRQEVRQRMWQPLDDMIDRFGFDIERAVWDEIVWTACGAELRGHVFKDWVGNPEKVEEGTALGSVCDQVRDIYRQMFEGSGPDSGVKGVVADVEAGLETRDGT